MDGESEGMKKNLAPLRRGGLTDLLRVYTLVV